MVFVFIDECLMLNLRVVPFPCCCDCAFPPSINRKYIITVLAAEPCPGFCSFVKGITDNELQMMVCFSNCEEREREREMRGQRRVKRERDGRDIEMERDERSEKSEE